MVTEQHEEEIFKLLDWKKTTLKDDLSSFKIVVKNGNKGQGTYTSRRSFMAKVLIPRNIEPDEDVEIEWFGNLLSKIQNKQKMQKSGETDCYYEEELNEATSELLYWLRYTFVGSGQIKWTVSPFTNNCKHTMVYKDTAEHIIQVLIQLKDHKGVSVYERINSEFRTQFGEEHNLFWDFCDESDGELTVKVPTLSTYLTKVWRLLEVSPLMMEKEEVELYTNNPTTHSYNFVDMGLIDEKFGSETPTIDSWLSAYFREDQIAAFRAWLYGTLCDNFTSRQVMYWEDFSGMSGKSTFITAFKKYIDRLAPDTSAAINMKSINGQFGAAQLHNKRIAFDSDVKNEHVMQGANIHKATGGDYMGIERKGDQPFDALVHTYFFLAGNVGLQIDTTARHERSRIIYLRMQQPRESYLRNQCHLDREGNVERDRFGDVRFRADNGFIKGVNEEMGAFIANCRPYFEKFSGGGNVWISPLIQKDMADTMVSEKQSSIEDFVDTTLEIKEGAWVSIKDLKEAISEYNDNDNTGEKINEPSVYKYLHNFTNGKVTKKRGSNPVRKTVTDDSGKSSRVHVMMGVTLTGTEQGAVGGIEDESTETQEVFQEEILTDADFQERIEYVRAELQKGSIRTEGKTLREESSGTEDRRKPAEDGGADGSVCQQLEAYYQGGWTDELIIQHAFSGTVNPVIADGNGNHHTFEAWKDHGVEQLTNWINSKMIKIVGVN